MRKKVLSMLLAAVLAAGLLSLSACGGTGDTPDPDGSAPPAASNRPTPTGGSAPPAASNRPTPTGEQFTTGDAWIDEQLKEIVLSQTEPGQTREEMLRAFFAYCRDNYKYVKWNLYDPGDTGFTLDAARQMLSTGRGNCYCFASVFLYLARWLGYDARIFSGSVLDGPHSWVEIDGYIYDTELEWRYVHDWGHFGYLWNFYRLKDSDDTFRYRK